MDFGELREGMKVRSADGTSLGKIVQLASDTIVVEKGFFFPKDYTISARDIADVRDDEVWLSVRDEALRSTPGYGEATTASTTATSTEDVRIPLAEEELEARKVQREAGEVRVHKEVITEHRQIDVPVTREEVRVERVPASASTTAEPDAFTEKTISVPVHEEEVEVTKRPRVREEVRVTKSRQQVERRAEADVRREEARVEDDTQRTAGRGIVPPDDEHH